jgi:type III pantothenate kinase
VDLTLAIDVGNSRIKFGLFDCARQGESRPALPTSVAVLAVAAAEQVDWRQIATLCNQHAARVSSAVVAGANPVGVERVRSTWPQTKWPTPRIINRSAELPVRTSLELPDHVGIDRLLNAVAANVLRPADLGAVIVSAGTATTVDLVLEDGTFAGGAILPGLELGARALHQFTALLPMIDVLALMAQGGVDALGRNTPAAISSGLWYGHLGGIREIVTRFGATAARPPLIMVTGGNGHRLAQALGAEYRFEADLALRGLAFVAQMDDGKANAAPARDVE